jgi:hypothetical protein
MRELQTLSGAMSVTGDKEMAPLRTGLKVRAETSRS